MDDNIITKRASDPLIKKIEAAEEYLHLKRNGLFGVKELIIGKKEAIDDAIKVLQGHFQVKDTTSLQDNLGVQIMQSDDSKKA